MSGTASFMAFDPLTDIGNPAVQGETAAEAVHADLRGAILTLELQPGTPLRIKPLSQRFAVGPTPLREALWRLTGEGLVRVEPQRGFHVTPLTRDDLQSLALLCSVTEPPALRRSIRTGGREWLASVRQTFAAFAPLLSKVGDQRAIDAEWERRHHAFHMAMLAGCGLPSLIRQVAAWYDQLDRYRRLALPGLAYNAATADDHAALVVLIERCAEDAAVDLLARHLADTQAQMLAYFDPPED
jgi:GntR family transcriptional regulator, carbon starvation induced regulator